ncbi:MAG: NYN domain-containing protein, partial [Rhodoplanes sp.]
MTNYIYVDNSNIYIEGCRIQAVKAGLATNIFDAMNKGVVDHTWNLDYGRLYEFFCQPGDVARLWGSPPPGDSFWEMVKRKGWEIKIYDKNIRNKEKKVDVAIGYAMSKDAFTRVGKAKDVLTLVAGDKDHEPAVLDLKQEGFNVEVAFWGQAASELKAAATKFINLDQY